MATAPNGDVYLVKVPTDDLSKPVASYSVIRSSDMNSVLVVHLLSPVVASDIQLFPLDDGRCCVWSGHGSSLVFVHYVDHCFRVTQVGLTVDADHLSVTNGADKKSSNDSVLSHSCLPGS